MVQITLSRVAVMIQSMVLGQLAQETYHRHGMMPICINHGGRLYGNWHDGVVLGTYG